MTRAMSKARPAIGAVTSLLTAALMLVGLAGGALADDTETPPPGVVPTTDTDFATTVSINQFDPSKGVLQSVTIELGAGVSGDMSVENLSTQSAGSGEVSLQAIVTASLQSNAAIGVTPALPTAVEPFTLDICDTPDPTTVTGCDETPDFAGPAGLMVTGLNGSDTTTATFTDAADMAPFVGTGSVVFDVAAQGNSSGTQDTGNVFFEFFTRASATVTVTYQFAAPAIDIEKATNGEDADDPTGPAILVGDPVDWTYVVTNTGDVDLSNVTVTDDQGVAVSCPQNTLAVGAAMTCTATGTAEVGQYANMATVIGDAPDGSQVTDSDPSHYIGVQQLPPAIDIEKATNGVDADEPTGPAILVGDTVTWTYVVTNIGDQDLSNVSVTDDQGVAVSCPQTTLAIGESMTCTASGTATVGQYANIGTTEGTGTDGTVVTDQDPSHYIGVEEPIPAIDIEKATNGEDADEPSGPAILVGDPVNWTYVVTNIGLVDLSNVSVVDDQGVTVTCPQDALAVGESMTCTASGTATVGQYANIGTTEGTGTDGTVVTDQDPSHYIGFEEPPPTTTTTTEPPPEGGIDTGAGGSSGATGSALPFAVAWTLIVAAALAVYGRVQRSRG